MLYKVNVPKDLISSKVTVKEDPIDCGINLSIRYYFVSELKLWLQEHLDTMPTICINRHDFDPPEYYIRVPSQEIKTQFEITWY